MKEILFRLNSFSSWGTALCCMFNSWRAEESRSTLPKMEKAAFTVDHSKIPSLVYTGIAYWCRLFTCTLKCWIYCYIILYTLQNGSGILWSIPCSSGFPSSGSWCACFDLDLPPAHRYAASTCRSRRFGDLDLFPAIGATLTPPLIQFCQ